MKEQFQPYQHFSENKSIYLSKNQGFTLIEVAVVLLVIVALAGVVIPYVGSSSIYAQCTATQSSMVNIRNAIMGNFEQPGYLNDIDNLPNALTDLFINPGLPSFNPLTKKGWRGPYLLTNEFEDGYLIGNDIIIQFPPDDGGGNDCSDINGSYIAQDCARLISFGPNGSLETLLTDASGSNRVDDHIYYLAITDPNPALSCEEYL